MGAVAENAIVKVVAIDASRESANSPGERREVSRSTDVFLALSAVKMLDARRGARRRRRTSSVNAKTATVWTLLILV